MEAGERERFGPYALLEKLGEGGMGEVWKALDTRLERVVALKLMKGRDESVRRALVAEAKTASQLTHPNIAVIFEAGEEGGVPFIAMEFVPGQSLASRLGERLGGDELLSIARQAAEALDHAHARGVIHRDIKPDNLVLTEGGHLEILDFGIARRAFHPSGEAASAPTQMNLTQPGVAMGTPAYMSPEQAYGRQVTPATDQFSLGVVLRELAIGEHVFKRESMVETLHAVVKHDPWRIADLRPDLPAAFSAALERMIEKRVEDRFKDLRAFLDALPATAGTVSGTPALALAPATRPELPTISSPQLAEPAGPQRRKGGLWLALGATGALMVAAGSYAFLSRKPEPPAAGPAAGPVVALLPLELSSSDAGRSWVATSLADAMNTSLLRREGVRVLDRQWVAEAARRKGFVGLPEPGLLAALARDLKADLLLVGDGRWDGERLQVRMRAYRPGRAEPTAETASEGSLQGLLALEDTLASRVQSLLGESVSVANPRGDAPGLAARAKNLRTRELYARGLELAGRGNLDAYDAARSLFQEAIALEPDYAPAHAGLAWALQDMGATEAHLGRQADALARFQEAEAAARRAAALDPRAPMAQRALAGSLIRQSKFTEARGAAARAVSLDPVDHHALVALADAYAYGDKPADRDRARQEYRRALDIAPSYWYAHFRYAVHLQNEGDLELSAEEGDRAAALQPSAEYAYLTASLSLLWLGRYDESRARLEAGMQQVPGSRLLKLTKALVSHATGDKASFALLRKDLARAWPRGHVVATLLEGLEQDIQGRAAAARATFLGESRRSARTDWTGRPASDRRGASVNLYHMARALALRGDPAAREILDTAEKLNPGKAHVARKDPAFRTVK